MINIESITCNCGGDPALVAELAQVFLEEFPQYLRLLDEAMSERSSAGIRLAAHRLRGSLAVFDAQASLEAATRLEAMSASSQFTVTPEAVAALKVELAQLEGEIRSLTSPGIKTMVF
ncbi:MAG TPA: Hpt domain-containing protein [Candidatus Angelobacter sp.]|nr:Hpt domain-containing protein [Candidatus Angelobacter sp.]